MCLYSSVTMLYNTTRIYNEEIVVQDQFVYITPTNTTVYKIFVTPISSTLINCLLTSIGRVYIAVL